MKDKKLTIIIPTLNEEKNLPNLLKDLVNQTFTNFNVIIVDAKSEDDTIKKANSYKKEIKNLKVLVCSERGVTFQRNMGAENTKTEWIVFMDADNRIPKYFMQGLKFYSEMIKADFITTSIKPDTNNSLDSATANIINAAIDISKNTPNPLVLESMILAKRKSFLKLKGFDTNIHWSEGNDLLRRSRGQSMKFEVIKDLKYTYSFRRLRKLGKFSMLQKIIQMEMARITKLDNIIDSKLLYPMTGGTYYKVDKKSERKIKDIFLDLFK